MYVIHVLIPVLCKFTFFFLKLINPINLSVFLFDLNWFLTAAKNCSHLDVVALGQLTKPFVVVCTGVGDSFSLPFHLLLPVWSTTKSHTQCG